MSRHCWKNLNKQQVGNSTFVAPVFSKFEVTTRGVGISLCKAPGLVTCAVLRWSRWLDSVVVRSGGCTANWLRHEGAVGAGRSRRPRRTHACGAGSTRIHHAGMKQPAIGAAATERWSVRGPGMRHGIVPLTTSELNPVPKGEQVLRRNLHCRF